VRRSGTRHLLASLSSFLARGTLRLTVGIDMEHTSYEGLHDLYPCNNLVFAEIYVIITNRVGRSIPNLSALNSKEAKLIVGSNNMTEDGLFVNVEAGLEIDARLDDPVISDVRAALATCVIPSRICLSH